MCFISLLVDELIFSLGKLFHPLLLVENRWPCLPWVDGLSHFYMIDSCMHVDVHTYSFLGELIFLHG